MQTRAVTDLTEPQSDFFLSPFKYTAAVAGYGSGKTECAITKLLHNKFKYPTVDSSYLAPTLGLIKDIFYPRVAEILDFDRIPYNINKGSNTVEIQGAGKVFCRSMTIPDSIVGWEAGDAFIDEFDLLPKDKALMVLRKISARLRSKFPDDKVNQLFFTTTPEGFKATYELFKKNPLDDSMLIQMSTESNRHNLPKNYIEDLRKQYPPELIDAYIEGKFVNLTSGAVYPYFNRDKHRSKRTIKRREPLHIGMDFNVGNMSAVIFPENRFVNGKPQLRIIGELMNYFDTPEIIAAIKAKFPENPITVYPDAAGKNRNTTGATISDHKLLKLAGFKVRALNKNPFVKDRVQSVNRLFEYDQLLINYEAAPETTEAVEQQIYNRNGSPDKDGGLDHPVDALGYRVCKDFLISKPQLDYGLMLGGG